MKAIAVVLLALIVSVQSQSHAASSADIAELSQLSMELGHLRTEIAEKQSDRNWSSGKFAVSALVAAVMFRTTNKIRPSERAAYGARLNSVARTGGYTVAWVSTANGVYEGYSIVVDIRDLHRLAVDVAAKQREVDAAKQLLETIESN